MLRTLLTTSARLNFVIAVIIFSVLTVSPSELQAWNTPVNPGAKYTAWTWTGAVDNAWDNGANWCGTYLDGQCRGQTTPPPPSATVVFSDACTTNCSPTLNSNASVFAINIVSFSGSIVQNGFKMTIGAGGFFQNSGTYYAGTGDIEMGDATSSPNFNLVGGNFVGGSGNHYVGMSIGPWNATGGRFHITSGTYTATSGLLRLQSSSVQLLSGVAFSHSNGTIQIDAPVNWNGTLLNRAVNNLILRTGISKRIEFLGDAYVDGSLTLIGATTNTGFINGNKIHLLGNLTHTGYNVYGSTTIRFARSSGEQVFDNTGVEPGGYYYVPAIEFDQPSTSASVRFVGRIGFGGSITATTTQGTFNTAGATFAINNGTVPVTPHYNAPLLTLSETTFASTVANGFNLTNLTVGGNFLIESDNTDSYSGSAGTVFLSGNLGGSGQIGSRGNLFNVRLQGSTAQTITQGGAYNWLPALTFANTNGGITFTGANPQLTGNLLHVTGSVTMPQPTRLRASTTSNISLGPIGVQNLVFELNCRTITLGQDLNVSGNVQFYNDLTTSEINGANMNVSGNISTVDTGKGYQGNATIRLVGSSDQTVDARTYTAGMILPNFEVASTGGTVTFLGRTRYYGSSWRFTSATTVDMTSSSQYFIGGGSNFTVYPGPVQFKQVLFRPTSHAIVSGGRMTVTDSLQLGSVSANRELQGNGIDVYGTLEFVNTGSTGSQTIRMLGSANRTIAAEASVVNTPNIEVAKTGAAVVSLFTPLTMSASRSFTVTSGSVDLAAAANTLTIPGTLSLATGTSVKLSGASLIVGGNPVAAGPYSSGTIVP